LFAFAKIRSRKIFISGCCLVYGRQNIFISSSLVPLFHLSDCSDLKDEVFTQAEKVSKQERNIKATVDKIKQLEEKERAIRQNWL
jgi:hypothetical protein